MYTNTFMKVVKNPYLTTNFDFSISFNFLKWQKKHKSKYIFNVQENFTTLKKW
jgi:hypothetical protein